MARKHELVARTDIAAEASALSPEEVEAAEQAREAAEVASAEPLPMGGQGITLTFAQLKELIGGGGITADQVAEIAAKAAASGAAAGVAKVQKPEIAAADLERKSVYNPAGDRDHPRPKLKCHMYFGSAPIGSPKEVTTLKMEEIEALNRLTPGHFKIVKLDRSERVVEVRGQMNSNRQLDRLWILLPEGDDQQNLYPDLASLADQCNEANRVQPEMVA